MDSIRNIAIIAHVDHGKTTLVDKMLLAGKLFRDDKADQITTFLDSNELERERGITIVSKNVSICYKGTKINIIDTPGHSDFGGEVERVLNMADGCLLLVDAFEGPMPQTRFVLQKALNIGLKPIVIINKVDKPNCRPDEIQEKVFDLMADLNATEDQLDFVTLFGSAKQGWMSKSLDMPCSDISPLLDAILEEIPPPEVLEGPLQMLITSLDFSPYVGRIAVGRVYRGTITTSSEVLLVDRKGNTHKERIKELNTFEGLTRKVAESVDSGDICAVIGLDNFGIGDTITSPLYPGVLQSIKIDEPTMSMLFTINNSPFFGREGKYVTSRHIYERLMREMNKNLALRVDKTNSSDAWLVYGRGIMHLGVLIETMRRENYELQVGQPQVIIKEINGKKCEPIEELTINVPEKLSGTVIDIVTKRKGEMTKMEAEGTSRVQLEFSIPSRGIIGLNNTLLTATAGEAVIAHRFVEFAPWRGEIRRRINGSIIALETGTAYAYSLNNLKSRGTFFIEPQEEVYEGQVIGEHVKENDLGVNVCKSKKLTNMRASGSDDKVVLPPPLHMSLEDALEYIKEDEYVEVTPKSMRMRKILLTELERKRQGSNFKEE